MSVYRTMVKRYIQEIDNYITGTSIPNLDLKGLLNHMIIIPNEEIINRYSKFVNNKFAHLYNKENLNISQILDALLPKLMSGEMRVK